ncbi:MAG: hypothetical protein HQL72_02355 [Magnetococcales bacterium]|nr:hypothetical protein [Magnetococcales bacterium]
MMNGSLHPRTRKRLVSRSIRRLNQKRKHIKAQITLAQAIEDLDKVVWSADHLAIALEDADDTLWMAVRDLERLKRDMIT